MDDLPPPIKLTQTSLNSPNPPSSPSDDPIFEAKINNPFSKFFSWIKDFIKRNQNITIKIPIIGVIVALSSFSLGLGSGYNWGFNAALSKLFPNSSPVLHREISLEGVIQKSASTKYYLQSKDNLWTLKPKQPITLADLNSLVNQEVKVLGNLTKEANLVEVSEIVPAGSIASPGVPLESNFPIPSVSSNPSDFSLPSLYPNLTWETNQKKLLIFTSGKRKIEEEGVYQESAQVSVFPQDFINYYIEGLKSAGFKQTLNSINPDGIIITYAKDGLFLTFGIKNIYKGSGDNRKLIGYRAFIEHD